MDDDEPKQKRLKNGSLYDMTTKRIVSGPTKPPINSENAREMQLRALAKKRLVVAKATNSRVAPELIAEYGDMAALAERAINLQMIASEPTAGKAAVLAHDALTRDSGLAEPKQPLAQQETTITHRLDVSPALVELVAELRKRVDGHVLDAHVLDSVDAQAEDAQAEAEEE